MGHNNLVTLFCISIISTIIVIAVVIMCCISIFRHTYKFDSKTDLGNGSHLKPGDCLKLLYKYFSH